LLRILEKKGERKRKGKGVRILFIFQDPFHLPTGVGSSDEVFVRELNAAGTSLVYDDTYHGDGSDAATAVALDTSGNAFVTGSTSSTEVDPIV
jgi:hypothetical protein